MMTRWWHRRSDPERFDLYTRASVYMLSGSEVLALGLLISRDDEPNQTWLTVVLALAVMHCVTCLLTLRGGLEWFLGRGPRPRRAIIATGALTVAGIGATLAAFPADESGVERTGTIAAGLGLLVFLGYFLVAVTPMLIARQLAVAVLGGAATVAAGLLLVGWPGDVAMSMAVAAVFGLTGAAGTYRASVWMLGVVWEIDRSRAVHARLAVAEERLRFSRDLHDVLGRNLSVIALKSELSAQLARRGRAEAAEEMLEVREIAQESLREVREVVRGYRSADLNAELVGARAVLRSAGVSTTVTEARHDIPADVQTALGWVVREATTNVLRHSDATTCTITVRVDTSTATLVVDNDGARPGRPGEPGSGLAGLSERLRVLGGDLVAEPPAEGRFRLVAVVPLDTVVTEENTA